MYDEKKINEYKEKIIDDLKNIIKRFTYSKQKFDAIIKTAYYPSMIQEQNISNEINNRIYPISYTEINQKYDIEIFPFIDAVLKSPNDDNDDYGICASSDTGPLCFTLKHLFSIRELHYFMLLDSFFCALDTFIHNESYNPSQKNIDRFKNILNILNDDTESSFSYKGKDFIFNIDLNLEEERPDRLPVISAEIKFFKNLLKAMEETEELNLKNFFALYEFNKFSYTIEAICQAYHHEDPPRLFPYFFTPIYPSLDLPSIMPKYKHLFFSGSYYHENVICEITNTWVKEFLNYFSNNSYKNRQLISVALEQMGNILNENNYIFSPLLELNNMFNVAMLFCNSNEPWNANQSRETLIYYNLIHSITKNRPPTSCDNSFQSICFHESDDFKDYPYMKNPFLEFEPVEKKKDLGCPLKLFKLPIIEIEKILNLIVLKEKYPNRILTKEQQNTLNTWYDFFTFDDSYIGNFIIFMFYITYDKDTVSVKIIESENEAKNKPSNVVIRQTDYEWLELFDYACKFSHEHTIESHPLKCSCQKNIWNRCKRNFLRKLEECKNSPMPKSIFPDLDIDGFFHSS